MSKKNADDDNEPTDLGSFVHMFISFIEITKREALDSLAELNKAMLEDLKLEDEYLYDQVMDAFAKRRASIKSKPKN
jgi:hypothetical protein